MTKTATHFSAGLLQPLSMPPEQIFHVGMHLLGPFPTSASGNKRVAVATDHAMCAIPTSWLCCFFTDSGHVFGNVVDKFLSWFTQHKLITAPT